MDTAVDFLLERFGAAGEKIAFVEAGGNEISYADFFARIEGFRAALTAAGVAPGAAVQLRGDFSADAAAWLIALWAEQAIVTPLAPVSFEKAGEFVAVGDVEWIVEAGAPAPAIALARGPGLSRHALYDALHGAGDPGLIIFSSGTTGAAKGALHDARKLLGKFRTPGKDFVTLAFLLFDHIAGIDTLLYCLANGSTIVCPGVRSPTEIARLVERHRVEVLPVAPSFLNMLLMSGAHEGRDLSSLKIITYGAEMMPQGLLERVAEAFPTARIVQKYGTSEIGALRSQSDGNRSRWLRIGGGSTEWRVVDGLLEIRTPTAMLGYLNAPSPFTEDGWYKTGDRVEVDGDMVRFLGRDSDLINVGGQKVFPAEVEAALREIEGVAEVAVFGRPHPMLGATVCARIRMTDPALAAAEVRTRIRQGLTGVLEPYKIPQKIEVTQETLTTERFKQRRG
jgi:acyl-CoA synthetase (AMP-forming)/AMP-acid ligase II